MAITNNAYNKILAKTVLKEPEIYSKENVKWARKILKQYDLK